MIHKHLSIQWVLDGSTDADVEPKQLIREEKMSFFYFIWCVIFLQNFIAHCDIHIHDFSDF